MHHTLLFGVIKTLDVGLKQMLHGFVAFSATFLWYQVFSNGAFDMMKVDVRPESRTSDQLDKAPIFPG